jgi:hypothetical protein
VGIRNPDGQLLHAAEPFLQRITLQCGQSIVGLAWAAITYNSLCRRMAGALRHRLYVGRQHGHNVVNRGSEKESRRSCPISATACAMCCPEFPRVDCITIVKYPQRRADRYETRV